LSIEGEAVGHCRQDPVELGSVEAGP